MDFISCAFNGFPTCWLRPTIAGARRCRWCCAVPSAEQRCTVTRSTRESETYFVHTPGLKVVCPASATTPKLEEAAIRDNNPVLFFEHKFLYRRIKEELPAEDYTVPMGEARVAREGRDVSVITYAAMVYVAIEAAETWRKKESNWKWWTCGRCCRWTATPSAGQSRKPMA